MIRLHSSALIVCYPDGHREPLDVHDLVEHLAADADFAINGLDPWVLEKVVESVVHHLRIDLQRDQVLLAEFLQWMQTLLDGYLQEAAVSGQDDLPRKLDLFETARRCGTGFELEFFSKVRQFLIRQSLRPGAAPDAVGSSATQVIPAVNPNRERKAALQITGLRRCAKFLSGRRRWSKRCSETRDEILDYIRCEAARTGASDFALLVLS